MKRPPRVFVCRCEDVTKSEIEHALALGLQRIEEIKRYTGLGTGPCQGRECMAPLVQILLEAGQLKPERAQPFTPRPPLEPVSFGTLASTPDPADPGHPGEDDG